MHTVILTAVGTSRSLSSVVSGEDVKRAALLRDSDHWFHWLIIWTAVVAVGCALEFGESVIEWMEWRWHRKDKPFQEDKRRWTIPASILGVLLVVGGIACEGYSEAKEAAAETAVRAYDEGVLTEAVEEAGTARHSAEAANNAEKAVEAKADALDTRMHTASGKLDKLDKRLAWRTITPEQVKTYKKALLPFAGSKVDVRAFTNENVEATTLAGEFIVLFSKAGWNISPSLNNISIPLPTDVLCRYDPDTAAGRALGAVMRNWGAIVLPQKVPGFTGQVVVGERPPP